MGLADEQGRMIHPDRVSGGGQKMEGSAGLARVDRKATNGEDEMTWVSGNRTTEVGGGFHRYEFD